MGSMDKVGGKVSAKVDGNVDGFGMQIQRYTKNSKLSILYEG